MSVFQRCVPDFNIVNETVTTVNQTRFKEALEMANAVTDLQNAAKYCHHFCCRFSEIVVVPV